MSAPKLYGLVLSGGRSRRMQRDKAALEYNGKPQLARALDLLRPLVERSFVSVRADQREEPIRAAYQSIVDLQADLGPMGGMCAAFQSFPDCAWLILACDLPFLDSATLEYLIAHRASARVATAYQSSFDDLPEPLCAIFEPRAALLLQGALAQGQKCPRAFLARNDVALLKLPNERALDNVNTAEEYSRAQTALRSRRISVRYFAMLREQAGTAAEELQTQAATPAQLYEQVRQLHGLTLAPQFLRVAVNDEFSDWQVALAEGDTVVFLPPVAGG